eukprot:5703005-Prymnesium_polylepis.1
MSRERSPEEAPRRWQRRGDGGRARPARAPPAPARPVYLLNFSKIQVWGLKFRYHPMVPRHPRTHQQFRSVSVSQLGRRRCIRFERHVG